MYIDDFFFGRALAAAAAVAAGYVLMSEGIVFNPDKPRTNYVRKYVGLFMFVAGWVALAWFISVNRDKSMAIFFGLFVAMAAIVYDNYKREFDEEVPGMYRLVAAGMIMYVGFAITSDQFDDRMYSYLGAVAGVMLTVELFVRSDSPVFNKVFGMLIATGLVFLSLLNAGTSVYDEKIRSMYEAIMAQDLQQVAAAAAPRGL